MLPGEAPPGRGAPGRGAPGRGAWGRGMGRSTGCADENGLLPTRGARGLGIGPGRGPGVMPGRGAWPGGCPGAGAFGCPGAGADGRPGTGPGRAGASAACAAAGGAAPAGLAGVAVASPLPPALPMALSRALSSDLSGALAAGALAPPCALAFAGAFCAAVLPPPKDSRSRRATGASTVDDADLTNSPWSFSRARTSLLVTPSSLANSCTRALPATTSPVYEATVVGPRLGFSYDALSSGLHGVLMFFATCSVAGRSGALRNSMCSTTAEVSGEPVMRSALVKARRRIACCAHCGSGCSHAPRPGRLLPVSTITAISSFSFGTATTRSSLTANSRFRHPTHVRTGPPA